MPILRVADRDDPRIADYAHTTDRELLHMRRLFVAEGRLVVQRLLEHGMFRVQSMLVTETAYRSLRSYLPPADGALTVYLCDISILRQIAGFNIHRGCLAIGQRPRELDVTEIAALATRLVILEDLADADNVGSVFRNAMAFGAQGILLSPRCCDPLYRKAIRTSMGAALRMPFARAWSWPDELAGLRAAGWSILALTPDREAADIAQANPPAAGRLALLLGNEGTGLSVDAERLADQRLAIRMRSGTDSINVATAAGIAMHRLFSV